MGFRGSRVQIPPSRLFMWWRCYFRGRGCYFRSRAQSQSPADGSVSARQSDTYVAAEPAPGLASAFVRSTVTTARASQAAMAASPSTAASVAHWRQLASYRDRPARNTREDSGDSSSRRRTRHRASASACVPSPICDDMDARPLRPASAAPQFSRPGAGISPSPTDPWVDLGTEWQETPSRRHR